MLLGSQGHDAIFINGTRLLVLFLKALVQLVGHTNVHLVHNLHPAHELGQEILQAVRPASEHGNLRNDMAGALRLRQVRILPRRPKLPEERKRLVQLFVFKAFFRRTRLVRTVRGTCVLFISARSALTPEKLRIA